MAEPKTPADIAKMSFEQAMQELEVIINKLDGGDVPLEESITIYERGAALQRHCESKLQQAEMRVQKIVSKTAGSADSATPATFE